MKTRTALLAALALATPAIAQPGTPSYTYTMDDAVTASNSYLNSEGQRRWSVSGGADAYDIELYERPTAQEFRLEQGRYGAKEFFEFLDITSAKVGTDARFLYVSITLAGRDKITEDSTRTAVGMMAKYGFRFSNNADGRRGFLVISDQPEVKNEPNTRWGPLGITIHKDVNGDVGGAADSGPTGLRVSKEANALEEQGMNGYEQAIAGDGRLDSGRLVAWVRLNPSNRNTVELALEFAPLGLSRDYVENLAYFDVEALKANDDPQNFHRNDKYSAAEAGSPYHGSEGESIFGTQGLVNIYECDNVRVIGPSAATLSLLAGAGAPGVCVADVDDASGTGFRDGGVDIADLLYYLNAFQDGSLEADVDDGSASGTDDDAVAIEDLLYYLGRFAMGC